MSMPPFTAKHLQQQSIRIDAVAGIIRNWNDREVMMAMADKMMRHALAMIAVAQKRLADGPEQHRRRCRYHALSRAWDRFQIALPFQDLDEIEDQVRSGRAVWIADLEGGPRQAYMVRYQAEFPIVVFDIRLDCAVTFLPDASWLSDAEGWSDAA